MERNDRPWSEGAVLILIVAALIAAWAIITLDEFFTAHGPL
jgi:hypothetical protein